MTNPTEPINHQSFSMSVISRLYDEILVLCPEDSDQYKKLNLKDIHQFLNDMQVSGVDDELLANYPDLLRELYNLQIHMSDLNHVLAYKRHMEHAMKACDQLFDHLKYSDIEPQLQDMRDQLDSFRRQLTDASKLLIQAIKKQEEKGQVQGSAIRSETVLKEMAAVLLLSPDSITTQDSGRSYFHETLLQQKGCGEVRKIVNACNQTIAQFYNVTLRVVVSNKSLLKKPLGTKPALKDAIKAVVSIRRVESRKRYVAKSLRQNVFMLLLVLLLAVGFALTSYYSLGMHIPIMHMIIGMSFTGTSLLGLVSVWFYQHTHAVDYVPKPSDKLKSESYDGLSSIDMSPIPNDEQVLSMSPV